MSKKLYLLLFVLFLMLVFLDDFLLGESLLDHKVLLTKYFEDFYSLDKERNIRILSFTEIFNQEEYEKYKKAKRDFIITSKHLKVSSYGKEYPSNKDYNLKNITYSLNSSGYHKNYNVKNVFDEDIETAWVENTASYGIGEWIQLNVNNEYASKEHSYTTYGRIIIYPGYGKSEKLFYENNRLKSALLFVATTDSVYMPEEPISRENSPADRKKIVFCQRLFFEDEPKYHVFRLPSNPSLEGTKYIFMLVIEDVYKGSKYNDTCISEIQLVW